MFTSPILTIGFALAIATGLVCFGVIRLLRYFRGETDEHDLPQGHDYSLGAAHNAVDPEVKRP